MSGEQLRRIDDGVRQMLSRVNATAAEADTGFPHYAETAGGRWTRTPDGFWTGGFWGGLLALSALGSGDRSYAGLAEDVARRLVPRARSDTAFRGFLFFYGAGVAQLTAPSDAARDAALAGARGLAASFHHAAGLIPLGTQAEEAGAVGRGAANIDAVPGTVALLAWAAGELGEPALLDMARRHAQRHVEYCVRSDGSICQSAAFDERDGSLLRRYTHKGRSDDSTWARAQAWAMLGFAQAGRWVSPDFLPTAVTVADWWIENLPADRVALWDFDAGRDEPRDTSATAIAAAALLKLAALLPDRSHYREHAAAMVDMLVAGHLTPSGALSGGCFDPTRGVATDSELVWGDYFLLESLLALRGRIEPASL
ncbi:glycoside hydrolase family 88 protein [Pseudonocardia kunmingensis]|uniref:Unsaturated chondroitin disaccharide hydrolase n=1 Tax=Pseudonocardia kunmingensis TaxID=630975 RepID=A0A543DVP4_9PSEU|nr:glycoside hydrolase family 88 protein [Pseudonocardia kunmingensis]TQM13390.1 unsaturated chondroitin disaccharide hydrolase [Pseudonocardia kunmingensis]